MRGLRLFKSIDNYPLFSQRVELCENGEMSLDETWKEKRETKREIERTRETGGVFSPLLCLSIFAWECRFNLWERKSQNFLGDLWLILTEDSSGRHRFLIYPEGHLGKDYCHDARDVRLNHEVAHFPFQVEIDRHHHVFTWKRAVNRKQVYPQVLIVTNFWCIHYHAHIHKQK